MCDVLLPPGVNPTAVKYIYQINRIRSFFRLGCNPLRKMKGVVLGYSVVLTWKGSMLSGLPCKQGRPLGGASGALAPGADFEGAPKRRSLTGHMLIRSTVAWWFPHLQTKRVAKDFLFNLVVLALDYCDVFWCLHMYIHVILYVYCCKYCWLPP
jgi:hypothetical protein